MSECPLASGTAVSLGQGWPVTRRFWNLAKPFGWKKRIKLLFPQKAPDRARTQRTQTDLVAQVRCLAAPANLHPSTLSETAPKTP